MLTQSKPAARGTPSRYSPTRRPHGRHDATGNVEQSHGLETTGRLAFDLAHSTIVVEADGRAWVLRNDDLDRTARQPTANVDALAAVAEEVSRDV